ncbi:5302_t:CDS:10, partial [Racocetra fulgida]
GENLSRKEIREQTRAQEKQPEPDETQSPIKLSTSVILAAEGQPTTNQPASYTGTTQPAIGEASGTSNTNEPKQTPNPEKFSTTSSQSQKIKCVISSCFCLVANSGDDYCEQHKNLAAQIPHYELAKAGASFDPTKNIFTSPTPQYVIINEPTSAEKQARRDERSQKAWKISQEEPKITKRKTNTDYTQEPQNLPPKPTTKKKTEPKINQIPKQKKTFLEKTKSFFVNETTAKVANAGGLYAGVACVVGFFKIKGAIALGTVGIKATHDSRTQEQVENLQNFAREKSQVVREVVENNYAGTAAALTPGKEYIRLSFAIFRAKKAGKDISELLAQRQKLISQRPTAKSREEINRDYYQKNRENLREEVRRKKQEKQEQEQERREREINELATKFYQANSIKVLASFKEYTELKKAREKFHQEQAIELAKFHEERGKKEKSKPEEREEVESDCGNCGEYKKVSVDSVKRVNSSHLKNEKDFTPKIEPKINQVLELIQQEKRERILLRYEISESIKELKE